MIVLCTMRLFHSTSRALLVSGSEVLLAGGREEDGWSDGERGGDELATCARHIDVIPSLPDDPFAVHSPQSHLFTKNRRPDDMMAGKTLQLFRLLNFKGNPRTST